jgi:hypothetical protein
MVFFQCEKNRISEPEGEGNASETVAKGIINDSLGEQVAGAKVFLIPADFNPLFDTLPQKWQGTTNQEGRYILNKVREGTFNLIAESPNGTKVLIPRISVSLQNRKRDTLIIRPGYLLKTGRVQIALSDSLRNNGLALYIKGTNIKVALCTSQVTTLENVPAMDSAQVYMFSATSPVPQTVSGNVSVKPQETTVISKFGSWDNKVKISFKTNFSTVPLFLFHLPSPMVPTSAFPNPMVIQIFPTKLKIGTHLTKLQMYGFW